MERTLAAHRRPSFDGAGRLPAAAQTADPGRDQNLIAHWRNTRIVFDSARDENMVLRASGSAEKWTVTATGRSAPVYGQWVTQAKILKIDWEDGEHWSGPSPSTRANSFFPTYKNNGSSGSRFSKRGPIAVGPVRSPRRPRRHTAGFESGSPNDTARPGAIEKPLRGGNKAIQLQSDLAEGVPALCSVEAA